MDASATVGFFGKLPCRGDFLRRRVPDEFVAAWDEWLQKCLTQSREQLGDAWRDAYLAGPICRFVLAEGVCGTGAYAGVLMPSVDRVGRCFPLTIVTQWEDSACAIDVACRASEWFDTIEDIAAEGLETSDLDAFDAQVARAESLLRLESVSSLQRAVNAFAARELERSFRPLSIWWSDDSDDVSASWFCARGLPDARTFAAMLTNGVTRERKAAPAPSLRITADHVPVTRDWNAPPSATHFVVRPEIGLWGVVSSETQDSDGTAAAQAIADALHGVEHAGSITVAAERVREALEAIQRQLERHASTGVPVPKPRVGAIAFVANGADCAVIFTGPVRLACSGEHIPLSDGNELLDLVMSPSIGVRYETLYADDLWQLTAASQVLTLKAEQE
jgi:type VI secretion system protein ImpM